MIAQIILAWVILSVVACGSPGVPAEEGTPCQTAEGSNGVTVDCGDTSSFIPYPADGQQGPAGEDGVDGTNGKDGRDGSDGRDGIDGIDGLDGADGQDGIIEVINLCGNGAEVILRLSSGVLIAHYSSGNWQFFAQIGPGTYISTDQFSCVFTVTADLTVIDSNGNTWLAP